MIFKLGASFEKTMFNNIFRIIISIILLFFFIYTLKNSIGTLIFFIVVILMLLAYISAETINKLKSPWPVGLQIDEKNQTLAIIYSNNHKQILNFNEITTIEIDMKEGHRSSIRNLYIKNSLDKIGYEYIAPFRELLNAIVCLRQYFQIVYTQDSQKYFDKYIKNYDRTGDFGMPVRFMPALILGLLVILGVLSIVGVTVFITNITLGKVW